MVIENISQYQSSLPVPLVRIVTLESSAAKKMEAIRTTDGKGLQQTSPRKE